jgi:hypothetical protein
MFSNSAHYMPSTRSGISGSYSNSVFGSTGVEFRASCLLARLVFHSLSHASSPVHNFVRKC